MTPLAAIAVRLVPGDDLKLALDRIVRKSGVGAACVVTCAGSLSRAALRLAGASEATVLDGPLEIVALSGTLSPDGSHLHLAVADGRGEVRGGHVREGCLVQTTAELVLGLLEGVRFSREQDESTGYPELLIRQDR